MKRLFLSLLVLLVPMGAAINMGNVTVEPGSTAWMSQDVSLHGSCTNGYQAMYVDNITNLYESRTFFDTGKDELSFAYVSSSELVLQHSKIDPYLRNPGLYRAAVVCEGVNESKTRFASFTLHELRAALVEDELADHVFAGGYATIPLTVHEEPSGDVVDSGTDFDLELRPADGSWSDAPVHAPSPFFTDDHWVLNTTLPTSPGTYDLRVTARHDGGESATTATIDVEQTRNVAITVTPTRIRDRDTIEVVVEATHRGTPVTVDTEEVTLTLDDDKVDDVTATTVDPGRSVLTFSVPDLSPGSYDLEIEVDTEDISADETVTLDYLLHIEGGFHDRDDNPQRFELVFTDDGSDALTAQGRGDYAGWLPPGEYDVTTVFDRATLALDTVQVDEWEDPIQYEDYGTQSVPGFRVGGLHAVQIGADYDTLGLVMEYSTRHIKNPQAVTVFHCAEWNVEAATCYRDWTETAADLDRVNTEATIDDARTGAYVIGTRDGVNVQYATDASTYLPDDTITVSGRVTDQDDNPLTDAAVTAQLLGVTRSTETDADGTYTVTFPAPNDARDYEVVVAAEKEPYADGRAVFDVTVERPPDLEIVVPDSVTMTANTSKTVTAYLENTGYVSLDDLTPVTEEVPFLQRVSFNSQPLNPGETRDVRMTLAVPSDTTPKTYTAELGFTYADEESTAVFGITVEQEQVQEDDSTSESTTGFLTAAAPQIGAVSLPTISLTPPSVSLTTIVLAIIALQIGAAAIIYRRRTNDAVERPGVMRTMSHIKDEVAQNTGL